MAGAGSGYDLSVSTFSSDGRLFQVEYASKATENSSTVVGICCTDGVVIAAERILHSRMVDHGEDDYYYAGIRSGESNVQYESPEAEAIAKLMLQGSGSEVSFDNRIYAVDRHAGMGICGLLPDGKALVSRAKEECVQNRDVFGTPLTGANLTSRIAQYAHFFTCYPVCRPFGSSVIIASFGSEQGADVPRDGNYEGPALYVIDCSGTSAGYHACALGKGKAVAKTELERLIFKQEDGQREETPSIKCRDAVRIVGEVLMEVHDKVKDKLWDIEVSWVCKESNAVFTHVPAKTINEIFAKRN